MARWRGDALKEAREAAQISRLNLAAQLGVTQNTVERWEEGQQVPSGQVLADLGDALGLELTELFSKEESSGSYRTHSRIGGANLRGEAADKAKLQLQVEEAQTAYDEAVRAFRRADTYNNTREAERMQATGDRLVALTLKLGAYDS